MPYILNLFTPETWAAFQRNGSSISGFSKQQMTRAVRVATPGAIFLCYMVRVSRWCGALEILDGPFEETTPIFKASDDPFVVRFRVRPIVILNEDSCIPLTDESMWNALSITRGIKKGSPGWPYAAQLVASLKVLPQSDGDFVLKRLSQQHDAPVPYPLSASDKRLLYSPPPTVKTAAGEISVEIPRKEEEEEEEATAATDNLARESIRMQARLSAIGAKMGFRIWVPRNDRKRVVSDVPSEYHSLFVDQLPFNYDDHTMRTIEQIDVLWLRNRRIVRAFEVEHTTAIYSGLLRMADLLAMQPQIQINLHIVAPDDKRERVMRHIKRPVFSLLEGGPLRNTCSYLSYSSIDELFGQPHLTHMTDSVLTDLEEFAEEE
jgi:hypothetical protein